MVKLAHAHAVVPRLSPAPESLGMRIAHTHTRTRTHTHTHTHTNQPTNQPTNTCMCPTHWHTQCWVYALLMIFTNNYVYSRKRWLEMTKLLMTVTTWETKKAPIKPLSLEPMLISDSKTWNVQLQELKKLPKFLKVHVFQCCTVVVQGTGMDCMCTLTQYTVSV